MLITVKNAAEQWCPHSRAWSTTGGINRDGTCGRENVASFNADATRCLGPKCMAWRWERKHAPNRRIALYQENLEQVKEPERPVGIPVDWTWCPYDASEGEPPCWVEPENHALQRRIGYCGLAGRPVDAVDD